MFRIASKITAELLPVNGGRPIAISYRTAPKENRSVRASRSSATCLFGRHVGDRADGRAGTGQLFLRQADRGCRWVVARGDLPGCFLGQPEIENLGLIAFGDKDVSRLDVTMDDALRVSRIEGVGHLNREVD